MVFRRRLRHLRKGFPRGHAGRIRAARPGLSQGSCAVPGTHSRRGGEAIFVTRATGRQARHGPPASCPTPPAGGCGGIAPSDTPGNRLPAFRRQSFFRRHRNVVPFGAIGEDSVLRRNPATDACMPGAECLDSFVQCVCRGLECVVEAIREALPIVSWNLAVHLDARSFTRTRNLAARLLPRRHSGVEFHRPLRPRVTNGSGHPSPPAMATPARGCCRQCVFPSWCRRKPSICPGPGPR